MIRVRRKEFGDGIRTPKKQCVESGKRFGVISHHSQHHKAEVVKISQLTSPSLPPIFTQCKVSPNKGEYECFEKLEFDATVRSDSATRQPFQGPETLYDIFRRLSFTCGLENAEVQDAVAQTISYYNEHPPGSNNQDSNYYSCIQLERTQLISGGDGKLMDTDQLVPGKKYRFTFSIWRSSTFVDSQGKNWLLYTPDWLKKFMSLAMSSNGADGPPLSKLYRLYLNADYHLTPETAREFCAYFLELAKNNDELAAPNTLIDCDELKANVRENLDKILRQHSPIFFSESIKGAIVGAVLSVAESFHYEQERGAAVRADRLVQYLLAALVADILLAKSPTRHVTIVTDHPHQIAPVLKTLGHDVDRVSPKLKHFKASKKTKSLPRVTFVYARSRVATTNDSFPENNVVIFVDCGLGSRLLSRALHQIPAAGGKVAIYSSVGADLGLMTDIIRCSSATQNYLSFGLDLIQHGRTMEARTHASTSFHTLEFYCRRNWADVVTSHGPRCRIQTLLTACQSSVGKNLLEHCEKTAKRSLLTLLEKRGAESKEGTSSRALSLLNRSYFAAVSGVLPFTTDENKNVLTGDKKTFFELPPATEVAGDALNSECAICYDPFEEKMVVAINHTSKDGKTGGAGARKQVQHVFCYACICQLLEEGNEQKNPQAPCPLCRCPFSREHLRRVHSARAITGKKVLSTVCRFKEKYLHLGTAFVYGAFTGKIVISIPGIRQFASLEESFQQLGLSSFSVLTPKSSKSEIATAVRKFNTGEIRIVAATTTILGKELFYDVEHVFHMGLLAQNPKKEAQMLMNLQQCISSSSIATFTLHQVLMGGSLEARYGEALFRERDAYSVLGVEALRPAPSATPSSSVNRVVTDRALLLHRDDIYRLVGFKYSL